MLVVLDTNILVSGLRSGLGASNAVLRRLALGDYRVAVSTALCLEYEEVLLRPGMLPTYTPQQLTSFLDSLCSVAQEPYIYFKWRPFLPDPKNDLVFECALAGGATPCRAWALRPSAHDVRSLTRQVGDTGLMR